MLFVGFLYFAYWLSTMLTMTAYKVAAIAIAQGTTLVVGITLIRGIPPLAHTVSFEFYVWYWVVLTGAELVKLIYGFVLWVNYCRASNRQSMSKQFAVQ